MSAQKIIVVLLLISLMLQSGLQVNRAHLNLVLKNYALLGKALLANFILVPLAAVLIVRTFHLDEFIAIGILLMAIAPGVPFLPLAAGKKAGGSLGFAVTLAFILPLISIATIPITARLVFPPDTLGHIPFGPTLVTLVLFELVPLLIGMVVAERAPDVAGKLLRPLTLAVGLILVALLIVVAPAIGKAVATVYGTSGLISALLTIVVSAALGWLLGGPETPFRNTLSIGTMLRNIGVGSLIATTNFAGTPVVAMVVSYFIIQVVVNVILHRVLARGGKTPEAPAAATV